MEEIINWALAIDLPVNLLSIDPLMIELTENRTVGRSDWHILCTPHPLTLDEHQSSRMHLVEKQNLGT